MRKTCRWLYVPAVFLLSLLLAGCVPPEVYSRDVVSLQQALARGGDANLAWSGWRPLNYAVFAGYPAYETRPGYEPATRLEKARLLLMAGADPNGLAYGIGGMKSSPLTVSAWQCRADMARLLLENGADPRAITETYGTPLSVIMVGGRCQTVDEQYRMAFTLLDHVERTQGREAMVAYARMTARKTVRFLPIPPLHQAVWQKYYGVLAALIEKRVDLDQLAAVGMPDQQVTALHLAESVGSADIAEILRRAGARDDILSSKGETPLAMRGRYVPVEATWTGAAVELAGVAAKVQSGDVIGNATTAYKNSIRQAMYTPTQAINRSERMRRSLGGPVYPPANWTGLEDAIRKAQAAREADARPARAR
ncbi:MAG: ankyrin repeat domain-containing protein [Pseudomonadota bacterium]